MVVCSQGPVVGRIAYRCLSMGDGEGESSRTSSGLPGRQRSVEPPAARRVGWLVQDRKDLSRDACVGVAVREFIMAGAQPGRLRVVRGRQGEICSHGYPNDVVACR